MTTTADTSKDLYFTVQVVESQRRYVLTGWTGRARFPLDPYEWSDSLGQCSRPTREVDYELPKCPPYPCEWVGDWEIYLGTDEKDWFVGAEERRKREKKSRRSNKKTATGSDEGGTASTAGAGDSYSSEGSGGESTDEPLKYTRFDDDGWEYAFDYPRTFRPVQSATMSWVRRRYWRRTFVVKGNPPTAKDAEDEIPFPDRFRICMLPGATDREKHLAAVADYFVYRPMPRVTDYKVGLRRIGLKLYKPADNDVAPRSRSQSAEKQRTKTDTSSVST